MTSYSNKGRLTVSLVGLDNRGIVVVVGAVYRRSAAWFRRDKRQRSYSLTKIHGGISPVLFDNDSMNGV